MNAIVAVDENWAIGKENGLLFSLPEDMRFFRDSTCGKIVICGRKTLESFPGKKPLPNRLHWVLTGSLRADEDRVRYFHTVDEVLAAVQNTDKEVFVIGGSSVYRQFLPYCRKVFVTKIFESAVDPDSYFPNLDESPHFRLVTPVTVQESANGLKYAFVVYENEKLKS